MADGMWTMTEDGDFVLLEPYKTMLQEAKLIATKKWREGLLGYLEEHSPYTWDELNQSLLKRADEDVSAFEMLDEFILEALGGDL